MKLYASGEDYLETILILHMKMGMVRSVDVVQLLEWSLGRSPLLGRGWYFDRRCRSWRLDARYVPKDKALIELARLLASDHHWQHTQ